MNNVWCRTHLWGKLHIRVSHVQGLRRSGQTDRSLFKQGRQGQRAAASFVKLFVSTVEYAYPISMPRVLCWPQNLNLATPIFVRIPIENVNVAWD